VGLVRPGRLAVTQTMGMTDDPRSSVKDTLSIVVPILSVGAVVAYALIREDYRVFYEQLGVTPEDIGLSSAQVLIQSTVGVLTWVLVVMTVLAGVFFVLTLSFKIRGRGGRYPLSRFSPIEISLITAIVVASLVSYARVLSHVARDAGDCASKGGSIRGISLKELRVFGLPLVSSSALKVVGVRAEEANVRWLGSQSDKPNVGLNPLFLGQSGGTVVLYDVRSHEPVFVPASRVAIRLRHVPENVCHPTTPSHV
jgi:hypothetical protein